MLPKFDKKGEKAQIIYFRAQKQCPDEKGAVERNNGERNTEKLIL